MITYIGLDAHFRSCTFAVISERGKRLKQKTVETDGSVLLEKIEDQDDLGQKKRSRI